MCAGSAREAPAVSASPVAITAHGGARNAGARGRKFNLSLTRGLTRPCDSLTGAR
jgi:hypothetical protein